MPRAGRETMPWFKVQKALFGDYHYRQLSQENRLILIGLMSICVHRTGEIKKDMNEICHYLDCKPFDYNDLSDWIEYIEDDQRTTLVPREDDLSTAQVPREDDQRTTTVPPRVERVEESRGERDKLPCAKKNTSIEFEAFFSTFWDLYPKQRKRAKSKCEKKLKTITKNGTVNVDEILDGLRMWIGSQEWTQENGRYICAPEVFLNQERWLIEGSDSGIIADVPKMEGLGL